MSTTTELPEVHQRVDYQKASPKALQAMYGLETAVRSSGLERPLLELVKLRASQINGCAFCIDMHTREAHEAGESHRRLHLVGAWREAPFFTARERAALAWTESLTLLPETSAPDDVYAELQAHFTPEEQVKLTMLIGIINAWNRFGAGFRGVHALPRAEKAAA